MCGGGRYLLEAHADVAGALRPLRPRQIHKGDAAEALLLLLRRLRLWIPLGRDASALPWGKLLQLLLLLLPILVVQGDLWSRVSAGARERSGDTWARRVRLEGGMA